MLRSHQGAAPMSSTAEKLSYLEETMARLACSQLKTEMSLQTLSREMREFKDEMSEYKDGSKKQLITMNRQKREFDVIAACEGCKVYPVFSSLYMDDSLVAYLTRKKIDALILKDDTMDIVNWEQ
jgi:hypothetical protein